MVRPIVAIAGIVVLLAGCAGRGAGGTGADPGDRLPADWQSGDALHPYQMFGDHGGGRGADLNPMGDLERPASCRAYRDDVSLETDSCEVRDTKYSWESEWPWIVSASWASCPSHTFDGCPGNDRPAPYTARVVAFDESFAPVAWWDGIPAPDTMYATE